MTVAGACVLGGLLLGGCRPVEGGAEPPNLPPAELYDQPPEFSGEWIGEVDMTTGALKIDGLAPGKYYGIYEVDGADVRYVLSLEQTVLEANGVPVVSNRCTFTWQDGHGGRGNGWLLINREDSALTGEFGEGEGDNQGTWTFIRVE
jgi:hypothetical protein